MWLLAMLATQNEALSGSHLGDICSLSVRIFCPVQVPQYTRCGTILPQSVAKRRDRWCIHLDVIYRSQRSHKHRKHPTSLNSPPINLNATMAFTPKPRTPHLPRPSPAFFSYICPMFLPKPARSSLSAANYSAKKVYGCSVVRYSTSDSGSARFSLFLHLLTMNRVCAEQENCKKRPDHHPKRACGALRPALNKVLDSLMHDSTLEAKDHVERLEGRAGG